MKVRFYLDSGANIHSCREDTFDTVEDFGLQQGEWEQMTEDEKMEYVDDWKCNYLDYGFQELDDKEGE